MMNIFLKPETIAYSWPAEGAMNISFLEEQARGFDGDVLSVQVDRDQAHNLIRELTEFCQRSGHALYQNLEVPMRSVTGVRSTIPSDSRIRREVIGICDGCGKQVPRGFYPCSGDGSHPSVGPKCDHQRSRPVFVDSSPHLNRQCEDCGVLYAAQKAD